MAAIVDGVKNAVTSQVAARANKSIRAGLTKVAGNLLGINTQFSGPQLGPAQTRATRTKYTTENLSYPLGVEEDPRQGHYILFYINERDKGKVKRQAFLNEIRAHESKIRAEYEKQKSKVAQSFFGGGDIGIGQAGINIRSFEEIRIEYIRKHIIADYDGTAESLPGGAPSKGRRDSSSLALQNPTTSRIKTAIALYMPPSVQVSYGADYSDEGISIRADIGAGIIQALKDGADAKQLLELVQDQVDLYKSIMLFGHNPTFTLFVNLLTGSNIINVVTSGVVRIDFEFSSWTDIDFGSGRLAYYEYPKKYDNL